MEEYKSKICPNCINEKCSNNIVTVIKDGITITKCQNYIGRKTSNKQYLDRLLIEIQFNNKT